MISYLRSNPVLNRRVIAPAGRCLAIALSTFLPALGADAAADQAADRPPIDKRLTDKRFFHEELDLERPGLKAVRRAARAGDYEAAREALADYYRDRDTPVWKGASEGLQLSEDEEKKYSEWGRKLLEHEKLKGLWTGEYAIDYERAEYGFFPRMYWWGAIGRAYRATGNPEIAKTWVGLMRGFVEQCPPPEKDKSGFYWEAMKIGIRLRSGWPTAFASFLDSEHFTADDIVVLLKSVIEQAEFAKRTHWPVGNKIAFAMVGLYSAGSAFPELTRASDWREYAVAQALGNLERGWFPDNMGVELSPGYHYAFKNYLTMVDIARAGERADASAMERMVEATENLFALYPKLAAPDGTLPTYQDGGAVAIADRLERALDFFPDNPVFQWFASEGERGHPPEYRSIVLPYAGYVAMRTGWDADANYVGFDVGPIGRGHAHQDKLNVVLWAYGRDLLIDPGHGDYNSGEFSRWALDTFSHNTALVDNRPQRRRWGKSGGFMPDKPLSDYTFETHDGWSRASGVYDEAYGPEGPSQSYPYHDDSTFRKGWGRPANHYRRVFFRHPDVVLVADTLVSTDGRPHSYEIRWTLNSTTTRGPAQGNGAVATRDKGRPNLAVVPLQTDSLKTETISARSEAPILGWDFRSNQPKPATTVRHMRTDERKRAQFVTLLLPMREGEDLAVESVAPLEGIDFRFTLSDGRAFEVAIPEDPRRQLSVVETTEDP